VLHRRHAGVEAAAHLVFQRERLDHAQPCSVSCKVSIVCAPPVNCTLMIARTRFTILRSMMIAGGATIRPASAITGSWITITANRPIEREHIAPDRGDQQRQHEVRGVAPVVSRAMNSEECRSEKKPMFSVRACRTCAAGCRRRCGCRCAT
jgi:hypothetical protein